MIKCPKCGEESEDQFDSCWKCGSVLRAEVSAPLESEPECVPDKLPEERSDGRAWLFSILVPLGVLVLAVAFGFAQLHEQSDWIGARSMLAAVVGSVLASIAALGFAARSILRAERYAPVAFVSGTVAFIYLCYVVIALSQAIK